MKARIPLDSSKRTELAVLALALAGLAIVALGQVLVAMAVAVVATSYLSRLAVKLESRPWFRRVGGEAEVGVEVPAR